MSGYIHTYKYIDACLPSYKPICINTTYMHAFRHKCMHTCIHAYIHRYIHGNPCIFHTDSQTPMFVCLQTFTHTYIYFNTFLLETYIILELGTSTIFGFAILQNFHTSGNTEIWLLPVTVFFQIKFILYCYFD